MRYGEHGDSVGLFPPPANLEEYNVLHTTYIGAYLLVLGP